jgi:hypothetical protein
MLSYQRLKIFNPDQKSLNKEARFHLFPKLPAELRICIWKMYLQKNRLIQIQPIFGSLSDRLDLLSRSKINSEEQMLQKYGDRYEIFVGPYWPTSKLFQVSRESRAVALEFYRIRLPCQVSIDGYGSSGRGLLMFTWPALLYINPEYDFIQIFKEGGLYASVIDIITKPKTIHHPRHVGICNLVVHRGDVCTLRHESEILNDLDAFFSTISKLQQILFLEDVPSSRQICGPFSNLEVPEFYLNRSLPLIPYTSNFEIIGNDPRPIAEGLARIILPWHKQGPLEVVVQWRCLCQHWGVSTSAAKNQVGVGYPAKAAVVDRTSAMKELQREEKYWTESIFHKRAKAENLDSVPRPAFGFWLFPTEAFGSMPADLLSPDYEAGLDRGLHRPRDMSPFWSKLALFDMD